jgi:hypothetical protein
VHSQIVRWTYRQAKSTDGKKSAQAYRHVAYELSQLRVAGNGLIYLKKPWMITIVEPAEVA